MFYVVLLFMVAAFLALRLYSVLGKRTGHEQPLPKATDARAPVTAPVVVRAPDATVETRPAPPANIEPGAATGLRAIIAAEPGFDVNQFLAGAQSAYRMVLEAFWAADTEKLAWLAEPDVATAFGDAIAVRTEAGHRLDNRLVSIEHATVTDAALHDRVARIGVRFDAVIAAVTRDDDGQAIAGSTTDAVETHDVWTFARTLKSGDPNWKLADTDEA